MIFSKNLYEEYAAPLLHLAGLKVSLFKTEHSGQAKDLMQVMDNTDAVLVVGGDGTLMEAVTGLLSRADRASKCRDYMIRKQVFPYLRAKPRWKFSHERRLIVSRTV